MTRLARALAGFTLVVALLALTAVGSAPAGAADASASSHKTAKAKKHRAVCKKLTRKARAGRHLTRKQRVRKRRACRALKRLNAHGHRKPVAPGATAPSTSPQPTAPQPPSGSGTAPVIGAPVSSGPPSPAPAPAPAPAPSGGACSSTQTIPTSSNLPAIRAAVLCLVNNERAAAGLAPLVDNGQLASAADGHSRDMVAQRYFAHTSLDGRTPGDRIAAAGYTPNRTWGENIAAGTGSYATAESIVKGWMNSPGHRSNILSSSYRDSGIGVALGYPSGGSGATYTHDFGSR